MKAAYIDHPGSTEQIHYSDFPIYLRNCSLYGFTVTDSTVNELQTYANQINQWLAIGTLRGKIAQQLPLSQAAEAHQIYESKNLFGKLVL